MHVWLVKLEEPVPTDKDIRPYRMSMLADALHRQGHTVTRWCSDYDHLTNTRRFGNDHTINYKAGYDINFIHSPVTYQKPVSTSRLLNNQLLCHKFYRQATKQEKPDIILCAMPTPSLAKASALLSQKFQIPMVLDARDMWPDIIEAELSGIKSLLAYPVIKLMKSDLHFACKQATGLVGITGFFRDHLLKYAGRDQGEFDRVFELGYQKANPGLDETVSLEFWKRKRLNLFNDVIIYFAGRLNSTVYSVFGTVLDAAGNLQQVQPQIKFVFCGTGQHREKMLDMAKDYANVLLPGEVDFDNLAWLRKHSLAAIQPIDRRVDYQNSLSNKFFECISSGLPIITWLDGISKEYIEKYNCGLTYNSAAELAQHVIRLYESPTMRKTLSRNALNLYEDRFSAEIIYLKFVTFLEELNATS